MLTQLSQLTSLPFINYHHHPQTLLFKKITQQTLTLLIKPQPNAKTLTPRSRGTPLEQHHLQSQIKNTGFSKTPPSSGTRSPNLCFVRMPRERSQESSNHKRLRARGNTRCTDHLQHHGPSGANS